MLETTSISPRPGDRHLLQQTTDLINAYAHLGLMLGQTIESFEEIAGRKHLVLAVTPSQNVLGSAALTFSLPMPGAYEFGSWAVHPDARGQGLGNKLMSDLFRAVAHMPEVQVVIAYANNNSGPVLRKMGGVSIDQSTLPDAMFSECLRCNCPGKTTLKPGQRCVDDLLDLTSQIIKNRP